MAKKILYISTVASEETLKRVLKECPKFPGMAAQKFNRLVAEGFAQNDCQVTALSSRLIDNLDRDEEMVKGVLYKYISAPRLKFVKIIWRSFYLFFYILVWGGGNRRNKAVVCDVLNISSSFGAIAACFFNRVQTIGIVTDVPTYSFNTKITFSAKVSFMVLGWFDKYVFLTQQMNGVINKKNRPYLVMEGLVQRIEDKIVMDRQHDEPEEKIILFAGGLGGLNGIPVLVDAFKMVKDPQARLDLYGYTNDEEGLMKRIADDGRIRFFGVRPNEEVELAERKATLLVNPRDINNPCVPYSFPSKNLEYMLSGTPLLTTRMCCIPHDHEEYLYFFPEKADASNYAKTISDLLSMSFAELMKKGESARQFVNEKKNNKVQTKRILEMVFK